MIQVLRITALITTLAVSGSVRAETTPTSDFYDFGDGTVLHKTTGLQWQRCAVGQRWTGSTCAGTYKTYTWDDSKKIKSIFAGHSDWRLPTKRGIANDHRRRSDEHSN